MKIAVALGKLGAAVHGKLNPRDPFGEQGGFATGTVSGFWGILWALAERGHDVDGFADVRENTPHNLALAGANIWNIDMWPGAATYDAYLSILESDLLNAAPSTKARILIQWLNDFSYCKIDPTTTTDLVVCPSNAHRDELLRKTGFSRELTEVVPLCCHPELYDDTLPRRPFSIAYASSPDRGLDHLLEMFPEVRRRVPGAELRIYYRVLPWIAEMLETKSQRGSKLWKRAQRIRDTFVRMGINGEEGIRLVGPLTTQMMIDELCRTRVLAYPCDPSRWTEGFSVTVLDACAAGCVPIISGVDAFPELWSEGTILIPGRPHAGNREMWVDRICAALTNNEYAREKSAAARRRAADFSRPKIGILWENVISDVVEGFRLGKKAP